MILVSKPKLPPIDAYVSYLRDIWETHQLSNNGKYVQQLEKELGHFLGVKHVILVTNGTLALHLMLKAFGIKGEVITTPFTFAATTTVLVWEGVKPVFVDVNSETFNIDATKIEEAITPNTTAILPVHVFGTPCDIEVIEEVAERYGLVVLYDAAHAFGVKHRGKSLVSYGKASAISFHATKTFNTIEGGAIVLDNDIISDELRSMRGFGIISENEVGVLGTNAKMNEFQAVMGLCNLKTVDEDIRYRKQLCAYYKGNLNNVQFQRVVTDSSNCTYMPVLFSSNKERNKVSEFLLERGVSSRKYFYPLTSSFGYLNQKYDLPVASDITNRILCLPMHNYLTFDDAKYICDLINEFTGRESD